MRWRVYIYVRFFPVRLLYFHVGFVCRTELGMDLDGDTERTSSPNISPAEGLMREWHVWWRSPVWWILSLLASPTSEARQIVRLWPTGFAPCHIVDWPLCCAFSRFPNDVFRRKARGSAALVIVTLFYNFLDSTNHMLFVGGYLVIYSVLLRFLFLSIYFIFYKTDHCLIIHHI